MSEILIGSVFKITGNITYFNAITFAAIPAADAGDFLVVLKNLRYHTILAYNKTKKKPIAIWNRDLLQHGINI